MSTTGRLPSVDELVAVVAVEHGGRPPAWAQVGVAGTLVILQRPDETPAGFARRVVHRISEAASGSKLERFVLSVVRSTEGSLAARGAIVQAALHAMSGRGAGNILLSAEDTADDDLRRELFALVGAWSPHLPAGPALGVRFGQPLRGVRRCGAVQRERGRRPIG